ncbi:MAG: class I SAM-dependent methyltransferase [Smithellaceae bacterium]|nr:class I SAM-dependent methyltransferase [Syntrophaceae bacterium]MDD4240793.1 class I SAM-dependent methyltransferase [Smithellaceae bacterium]NLX51754.1 class I SAM-dependent methyltransferase [Deltaproteobacteria bacterium]
MADFPDKRKIRQVFRNVQKHRQIEQLIRRFSSAKEDIRLAALDRTDLSSCRTVLELGCAFGAFTEALKSRLHPEACITGLDIIAEYGPFFREACARAGYPGRFSPAGVESIRKFPSASYDLILCSYALYFFVDMIPQIARILKKDGLFITITHDECNMQELIHLTRATLKEHGLLGDNRLLPVESILRQFSAANGRERLGPYFGDIRALEFPNTLVFQPWEIYFFVDYYQFKSPFFLLDTGADKRKMVRTLLHKLQDIGAGRKVISMCKDDAIFLCRLPLSPENPS